MKQLRARKFPEYVYHLPILKVPIADTWMFSQTIHCVPAKF